MLLLGALLLASSVLQPSVAVFLDFGPEFVFGTVQDAYQVEGSLAADGAGASHLDVWCQWNLAQANNTQWELCGDTGAGFYAHALDDVEHVLKALGQRHFHFQIAWARVFPDGSASPMNEAAAAFYDRLIDALLAAGITPWVSIAVFDYPQVLQHDHGGWVAAAMVPEYAHLAAALFARYGGRVRQWFSFHEPASLCLSYATGGRFVGPRPNANDSSVADPARDTYACMRNTLLAHAAAAVALRASPTGAGSSLSFISDSSFMLPNSSSAADAAAVERYLVWHLAAWFDPLVTGDWPPEMRALDPGGERLPFFSPAEQASLKNSSALLGLNHYSTMMVAAAAPFPCSVPPGVDSFTAQLCVRVFCDHRCGPQPNPALSWFFAYPPGMRAVLRWLGARYPRQPLLVAESGVGLDGGSHGDPTSSGDIDVDVADSEKVAYLTAYWAEAHAAMTLDGVDLRGIFHWSLFDNLEWASGFAAHFGIVHVNHSRADLARTPKASAFWLRDVVARHGFDVP